MFLQISIFLFSAFVLSFIIKKIKRQVEYWHVFLLISLILAVIYKFLCLIPQINNDPLSLSFSDGSWMYLASMFRSREMYGTFIGYPFLNLTKVLLLSIPFIFNGLPIWVHRAWDVFLTVSITSLTSWSLIHRLHLNSRFWRWVLFLGGFLFIQQGPVYYFLQVPIIIMLTWFDPKRFWRSAAALAAATVWASLSRINWIPYPGILAVSLYILETPFTTKWPLYFKKILGWFLIAIGSAAITILIYNSLPGNDSWLYSSSTFTTPLAWYRMGPSPEFRIGMIPGIALLSLPLLELIFLNIYKGGIHRIRVVTLSIIFGILFIGSTVVSVKYGGGSNLHNYDTFYMLLLICGLYLLSGNLPFDKPIQPIRFWKPAFIAAFLIPVAFTFSTTFSFHTWDEQLVRREIDTLDQFIQTANENGEPVLFSSQRQLLAFGLTAPEPFITDYDHLVLIEMSMAENRAYLQEFYQQLEDHAYAYIIIGKLYNEDQPPNIACFLENNQWRDNIVIPILDNYQMQTYLPESGLAIYVPRE
jgi:hypothetical protein